MNGLQNGVDPLTGEEESQENSTTDGLTLPLVNSF